MRVVIAALALLAALAVAADSAGSRPIELRAKVLDPSSTLSLLHPSVKRDALPLYAESGLYLIQARGRVSHHFRAAVANVIGRRSILHYIPRDTLLVKASLADLEPLSQLPEVPTPLTPTENRPIAERVRRFTGSARTRPITSFRQRLRTSSPAISAMPAVATVLLRT